VARNRPRNRSARPLTRPARPLSREGGDERKPPIEEDPVAFYEDDDEDEPVSTAATAADAFGTPPPSSGGSRRSSPLRWTIEHIEGSWAELRRVQWPDRQQVAQATGVVLGFVILTGVFLGVADFVAGKLVNWIV
jgi:preprotein translocase SecE subunit